MSSSIDQPGFDASVDALRPTGPTMTIENMICEAGSAYRNGDLELAIVALETALEQIRPHADGRKVSRDKTLAALGWDPGSGLIRVKA